MMFAVGQGLARVWSDVPPRRRVRRKNSRKRGRRVAKDEAARPIPVSAVDQMATPVVE